MSEKIRRAHRALVPAALAVLFAAEPAAAQKAGFAEDLETMRGKFTSLAGAMGADTYGWRPMDGVRSVSEVYMLIAAEAYYLPSLWGAAPPEGVEISNQMFQRLEAITDRDEVLEHLETSFGYAAAQLDALPPTKLAEEIDFFGQQRTVGAALYILLTDMHEHLGQAIAYARTNRVVPPWSAGS
ncbi:MAG: DinB family protein [Gemmatimonadota bacterium]|nr:DinB family protein [Gemmatimonadota bacterium]